MKMTMRSGTYFIFVLVLVFCVASNALSQPTSAVYRRATVLISDLHLGVGHVSQDEKGNWTQGEWDNFEDFRWTDEFSLFLDTMQATGDARRVSTDLVIVGDFLELWQTRDPTSCTNPSNNKDLGCTSDEALKRVRRVLGAHGSDLALLKKFASTGDNRLIIIPGNHDAALVFPAVANAVISAIGAPEGRVEIATKGYWLSADRQVFAEHGHQIDSDVNRFDQLPASCLSVTNAPIGCSDTGAYLKRPWGEEFVNGYYNSLESQYPIIDNIQGESNALRFAVSEARIIKVAEALDSGFEFFLFGQSVRQFAGLLGNNQFLPKWDLDAVRNRPDGMLYLAESFAQSDDLIVNEAIRRAKERTLVTPALSTLTDEQIQLICDARFLRWKANTDPGKSSDLLCPLKNKDDINRLGAVANFFLSSELQTTRDHLAGRAEMLKKEFPGRTDGHFKVFVFGHTHTAQPPKTIPFDNMEWRPVTINTGAWQRTATVSQIDRLINDRNSSPNKPSGKTYDRTNVLTFIPEDLPPCYTYVYIGPYGPDSGPKANLLYWVRDSSFNIKKWRPSIRCPIEYELPNQK